MTINQNTQKIRKKKKHVKLISDDYQKMIISFYLCQDKMIEILKHEYFTHKFKERVAVYYFEQKEYEELSH